MKELGLRERKRAETANALAETAFKLALEQGLDGFVVEDIVQRAGYSRRTFANYFSCKEEAVAKSALAFGGIDEMVEMLDQLPDDIPLVDILQRLMSMQLTVGLLWKMRELVSLSKKYPTLEPFILSVFHLLQLEAQTTLAALNKGRYSEEYVLILVGAFYGAILLVVNEDVNVLLPGQTAVEGQEAMTFDHYLEMTLGYLRNGF